MLISIPKSNIAILFFQENPISEERMNSFLGIINLKWLALLL